MRPARRSRHFCTPSTAARKRSRPCLRLSSMLSMTTILLSSVMPIANATPASEMTLIVRPAASSPMNAAIVQTGMPSTPTAVARHRPQEQEHHGGREKCAQRQVQPDVANGGLDVAGILGDQLHLHAVRLQHVPIHSFNSVEHRVLDIDNVRAGLAIDRRKQYRLGVEIGVALYPRNGPARCRQYHPGESANHRVDR